MEKKGKKNAKGEKTEREAVSNNLGVLSLKISSEKNLKLGGERVEKRLTHSPSSGKLMVF